MRLIALLVRGPRRGAAQEHVGEAGHLAKPDALVDRVGGRVLRVGEEVPWNIGRFYGSSYFADPRGQIVAQASETADEMLIADLDFDLIRTVRNTWQFYRDRRPETYGAITEL